MMNFDSGNFACKKCGARFVTRIHQRPDGSDCGYLAHLVLPKLLRTDMDKATPTPASVESVMAKAMMLVGALDAWQKENGWAAANTRYSEVGALHGASTVAALKARVAELEKDAEPEEFTRGIDAAAKMLDKMADDYSNAHAVQDPDTGIYEFGRGAKEDYYNTLRELADDIRSIVYAPGERKNTAQTLKAVKDAALEQAAILLECEYAEDAKQKRRLDQIAQHIRDLKKRSL